VLSAERRIRINRPIDEVFAFVADGTNAKQWRKGVLDIALQSGQGAGAVYTQGVKGPRGRRIAADYLVTAYDPPHRLAFRAIAGPIRPHGSYVLEPIEDDTLLTFSLAADIGFVQRIILRGPVQESMNAEMAALDTLKRILEARPTAPETTAAEPTAAGPTAAATSD
jgi:hypothetical protein